MGLPRWLNSKESACQAGHLCFIPEPGISPGEGNNNALQYSCLGNLIDRGPWWAVVQFSSVQLLSHVWFFAIPWTAADWASLSIANSWSLFKVMSIETVMSSSHPILCRPLLLLPSTIPSIRVFLNEAFLPIRWPKNWSISFRISPSNEYSGLISFRVDWLDLLAVQVTLKVFSNTTIQKHQFFGAQLSLWSNSHIHTWLLEKP